MKWLASAVALCIAANCDAEVTDVSTSGFHVYQRVDIHAETGRVWAALTRETAEWWNPDLTVSGEARWMRIDLRPGGCLCERFDESNGLEHLRVSGVRAPRFLRLNGGLGPLGLMGVNGNLTIELFAQESGTAVELIYAVGGYHPDGLDSLADPVDAVTADILSRLRQHVERAHDE
jgi:hypothetical protein